MAEALTAGHPRKPDHDWQGGNDGKRHTLRRAGARLRALIQMPEQEGVTLAQRIGGTRDGGYRVLSRSVIGT